MLPTFGIGLLAGDLVRDLVHALRATYLPLWEVGGGGGGGSDTVLAPSCLVFCKRTRCQKRFVVLLLPNITRE